MPGLDPLPLARHLDHIRRFVLTHRTGVSIHPIPRAWMSIDLSEECGEVPSNNPNRVGWFALESPPSTDDIRATIDILRSLSRRRAFFWLGPHAWNDRAHADLQAAGAMPWPYVEYPVLARAVGDCPDTRPTDLHVRVVGPDEAPAVLAAASTWYTKKGTESALRLVQRGQVEMHAAFDGPTPTPPVSIAVLIMDGPYGYLGWAGTDPERRKRGGQTALIRSRMQRAAALGAQWLAAETVTADMTSTNNMLRCGFQVAFNWHVYRWDDPIPEK